ncbi:ankyrin repeat domain-containing protein [Zunongwangia endophytica]|uniref:Ankyrin repeat domain-containing protein n=1 Tax=Zunongwangia endophytica TaxID=1808945 RepID=A0ABV8H751_9FLAO|nr:ankyrin repeat domain-containing protein [Zunongwangia endophytica]MDN3595852.1 ankyrin repeat domain-containing protein [Zunongwangia endophytica]
MLRKLIFFFLIISLAACKTAEIEKVDENQLQETHKKLLSFIENDSVAAFKNLFEESNFQPNHANRGTTLLFKAVGKNNLEITQFLLKNGADVNYISNYGTVMHWALETDRIKFAELLLNSGFDASVENKMVKNPDPLNVKAAFLVNEDDKNIKLFRELLKHGMNPNLKDRTGASALILACYFANSDLISLLYKNGADMNIKAISWKDNPNFTPTEFTINQYTPLMIATLFEKTAVVAQLLGYPEVDQTIKGLKNKKTAYDIALETKNDALIALFE